MRDTEGIWRGCGGLAAVFLWHWAVPVVLLLLPPLSLFGVFVTVPGVAASLLVCQSPTRVMAAAPGWQGTWARSSASWSPGCDTGAKAPYKDGLGRNNSFRHTAKLWSCRGCVRTRAGPLQVLRANPPPQNQLQESAFHKLPPPGPSHYPCCMILQESDSQT